MAKRPTPDPAATATAYDQWVRRDDSAHDGMAAQVLDDAREAQARAGRERIARLAQARRAFLPLYLSLANAVSLERPVRGARAMCLLLATDIPKLRRVLDRYRIAYRCPASEVVLSPFFGAACTIRNALKAVIARDGAHEFTVCMAAIEGFHSHSAAKLNWPNRKTDPRAWSYNCGVGSGLIGGFLKAQAEWKALLHRCEYAPCGRFFLRKNIGRARFHHPTCKGKEYRRRHRRTPKTDRSR